DVLRAMPRAYRPRLTLQPVRRLRTRPFRPKAGVRGRSPRVGTGRGGGGDAIFGPPERGLTMDRMTASPGRRVLLAAPRGYCAGVDRAVIAVEKALEQYGAPIYVRHEIVHNKYVVQTLEKKGAVFVERT